MKVLYGVQSANREMLEDVKTERELLVELLKHYNRTGQKVQRIINMLNRVDSDIDRYVSELDAIQRKIDTEIERGWAITEGK